MSTRNSKSNRNILVVDDNHELRTSMGLMLANEGYAVSHATNGHEALSLYRSSPFDLVIAELTLRGRDSFQTIMELRRQPVPAKWIATARTGWMSADFCLRMAEHLGAHHTLARPFASEQLLAAVRSALEEN
ncbi:MAG: response regulator [Limisphaerales bacterium]